MKKVVIAFDCDGTLVTTNSAEEGVVTANERVRTLLIAFASMKNTKIIVWSGGGEVWARQCVYTLGLESYVDIYASKNHLGKDDDGKHVFDPEITPDIAIDDIHDCQLGKINLIVREK
jgi:phosphoserine phosphatase